MQELMKSGNAPMLFPYEPAEYWQNIRLIIREEVSKMEKEKPIPVSILETPGLTYKPLLKISELCALFQEQAFQKAADLLAMMMKPAENNQSIGHEWQLKKKKRKKHKQGLQ